MKWLDQTMAVKGVSISRLHLARRPDYRLSEPGTQHSVTMIADYQKTSRLNRAFCPELSGRGHFTEEIGSFTSVRFMFFEGNKRDQLNKRNKDGYF